MTAESFSGLCLDLFLIANRHPAKTVLSFYRVLTGSQKVDQWQEKEELSHAPSMAAASFFFTAIAPIPIRAEKPNDQPSGEPGEQYAQSYRDNRPHKKSSENISRSWMFSICRADQGLKGDR